MMFGSMFSNNRNMPQKSNSFNINQHPYNNQYRKPYNNNRHSLNQQQFHSDYWCETCDRGFKTNNILEEHKKQHQKCNIDGCQFIAHPKVIIKHVQMQHSTGLYKKIAKLNNPEEIEKWREDRRKKYPTKANIEKKILEVKEKINRGEKMGIGPVRKQKDFQNKRKKPYDNNKKPKQFTPNVNLKRENTPNNQLHPKNYQKIISVSCETRKLKPFPGIQQLITEISDKDPQLDVSPDLIEDDEFVIENQDTREVVSTSTLCGALTSLINEYGSSDEEETDMNISNPVNKNAVLISPEPSLPHQTKVTLKENSIKDLKENLVKECEVDDNDSGPEEIKVVKEVQNEKITENKSQKQQTSRHPKDKHQSKKIVKNVKHKIPSTLLEKLLHNEIRQERNIILQCVRHIINNNYFNKTI